MSESSPLDGRQNDEQKRTEQSRIAQRRHRKLLNTMDKKALTYLIWRVYLLRFYRIRIWKENETSY